MEVSPFSVVIELARLAIGPPREVFLFFLFFFAVLKTRQCDSAVVVPFFEGIKPRGLRELKSKKAV